MASLGGEHLSGKVTSGVGPSVMTQREPQPERRAPGKGSNKRSLETQIGSVPEERNKGQRNNKKHSVR